MNNENNGTVVAAVETVGAEIGGGEGYQGAEVTAMNNETTTQAAETTTQAAETTAKPAKAKKQKAPPRVYPFLTKAQISAQIESDFSFACQVICILYDRQTRHEQETKSTLNKNRRGFMSSHAVHGSRIAELLRDGVAPEALSDEDKGRVMEIAPRYTKQMAAHFREEAIERDPSLAEKSACFFSGQ